MSKCGKTRKVTDQRCVTNDRAGPEQPFRASNDNLACDLRKDSMADGIGLMRDDATTTSSALFSVTQALCMFVQRSGSM